MIKNKKQAKIDKRKDYCDALDFIQDCAIKSLMGKDIILTPRTMKTRTKIIDDVCLDVIADGKRNMFNVYFVEFKHKNKDDEEYKLFGTHIKSTLSEIDLRLSGYKTFIDELEEARFNNIIISSVKLTNERKSRFKELPNFMIIGGARIDSIGSVGCPYHI